MKYDYLIVGCGLYGSVIAQRAIEQNKTVLIVDKRNHIGGNCYSERVDGIDIHTYGPHIFHTNNERIWKYVNRFATFNNFINRPKVIYKDKIYSFPINLMTLYQVWGVKNPTEAKRKLENSKLKITNPSNLEEWILSEVGEDIYNIFIRGYTTKQWNRNPKNLPISIIKRLPIRLSFEDNYFCDEYQGIPIDGYTTMISNMIQGAEVHLGIDYFDSQDYWDSQAKNIVYTGQLDRFFNYIHGKLEYRSLSFETECLNIKDYQGNAIINYTEETIPYTRIIEHKHFNFAQTDSTIITKEYPADYKENNEPYYPINSEHNQYIYNQYYMLTKNMKKYIFGGRLAEYRYYDMHQVIASALKVKI